MPECMDKFLRKQLELITKERDYDLAQTLERYASLDAGTCQKLGISLLNLRVTAQKTGFGGRWLVHGQ